MFKEGSLNKKISSYNYKGIKLNTYESITIASKILNINIKLISSVLNGHAISTHDLVFKYGDANIINPSRNSKCKKIVQYDANTDEFLKVHCNVSSATKFINNRKKTSNGIKYACKHNTEYYNFKWRYYIDGMEKYKTYTEFLNNKQNGK